MAIEKLNKTFASGEVLEAADLNNIKDKVNEVVDGVNTSTDEVSVGDTEPVNPNTEIWVDTSVTKGTLPKEVNVVQTTGTSTTDVMSQDAVTKIVGAIGDTLDVINGEEV